MRDRAEAVVDTRRAQPQTACGRICMHRKKIDMTPVLGGNCATPMKGYA